MLSLLAGWLQNFGFQPLRCWWWPVSQFSLNRTLGTMSTGTLDSLTVSQATFTTTFPTPDTEAAGTGAEANSTGSTTVALM